MEYLMMVAIAVPCIVVGVIVWCKAFPVINPIVKAHIASSPVRHG